MNFPPPSQNWADKTIWTGDNLHVMRGMNSASVDLIYLDPPFNSKTDYAAPIGSKAAGAEFKDTWTLRDVDTEWINLMEARHPRLYRVLLAAMTNSDKSYLVYMAVRLLEMQRILRPTGSVYLHCDPTMSHYLKAVMDAIFGQARFQNEIIWRRTNAHPLSIRKYEAITDTLLYYTAGPDFTFNGARTPMTEVQIKALYNHADEHGRFASTDLTGGKQGGADAYRPFKGVSPSDGRAWAPPSSSKFPDWARALLGDGYDDLSPLQKCHALDDAGLIHWTRTGRPRLKRYIEDEPTQSVPNLWTDIPPTSKSEQTGYPTQKPLALLKRVIEASSQPRDIVFDPFCGCATALVAAEDLGRSWVGIDISKKAADLVVERIEARQGMFRDIVHRSDIPQRTDLGKLLSYNSAANRKTLYGEQGGSCAGCNEHFKPQHLEVDHIIAVAKGGTDHISNLQLLCGHCNRVKGDRGMEYLRTKLQLVA